MSENVLIIRSSEWLRGRTGSRSYLKSPDDGTYCCIGLDARRRGIKDEEMVGIMTSASLVNSGREVENKEALAAFDRDWNVRPKRPGVLPRILGPDCVLAMQINDAGPEGSDLGDDERIERLRPIFAARGIEIDWRPNE